MAMKPVHIRILELIELMECELRDYSIFLIGIKKGDVITRLIFILVLVPIIKL